MTKRKLKIAVIVNEFPVISETFILNQIKGLIDRGHEITIFSKYRGDKNLVHPDIKEYNLDNYVEYFDIPNNKTKRIVNGIPIFFKCLVSNPYGFLKSINFIKYKEEAWSLRLLYVLNYILGKQKNFDIIEAHFGPNGIIGMYLRDIGIKGRLFTFFHGYDISRVIKKKGAKYYDTLFESSSMNLPVSKYFKDRLVELGCPHYKVIQHKTGIDVKRFAYQKRNFDFDKAIRILSIGRLVEKKGYIYALDAIATLIQKYTIRYTIVGDGPLRNSLEDRVIKLGINDYVKFLGKLNSDKALQEYYNSDIFLLSSVTARDGDQEGIPTVLKEAQATGMPVISTNHTGIPEVVLDKETGFIVNERDSESISDKLKLLINSPHMCKKMGKAGRKFIEENFNLEASNNDLEKLYSSSNSSM